MNKLLLTASVASLAIAPLAANAGDAGKAYFGAHGEYLFSSSLDNESAVAPGFAAIDVDADQGYGFGLAFGYNITDDFRAELEGNYRSSDIKVTGNFLGFPIKETATLETLTASANAYYDF
ncbi:MAG: hypothetical protein K0R98_633, partial [Rickettsiaceae bacterium]|nr:hypothetical protein [Rickettsiaceae bacterium]